MFEISKIGMITDYQLQGDASGVKLACSTNCMAISGVGDRWQYILEGVRKNIIFYLTMQLQDKAEHIN